MNRLSLVVLALLLTGCGVFSGVFGSGTTFGGSRQVEFRIVDDLNSNYPVAVELIVVYDAALEKQLLEMTATKWFTDREQLKRDFTSEQFETWRWEWTPGQVATPQTFRYNVGALSTILFASYASPGDHRTRVDPNRNLVVALAETRFTVQTSP